MQSTIPYTIRRANITDLPEIQRLNLMLFQDEQKYTDKHSLSWTFSEEGTLHFTGRLTDKGVVFLVEVPSEFWIDSENNKNSVKTTNNTIDRKNRAIGYLCGSFYANWKHRIDNRIAILENIFIEPEYRGNRIGTALLDEFLRTAKGMDYHTMRVDALYNNVDAQRFYKSFGFEAFSLCMEKTF